MQDRRYTADNFYRKGQFNVWFLVEPVSGPLDLEARARALHQLLFAIHEDTTLKISSFIDVDDPDDTEDQQAVAEFVVYNKLGVQSLGKLKRFFKEHLVGAVTPRIVLIDPVDEKKFRCTDFTIQYLFHDFVAFRPPDDLDRLKELLQQQDQGYSELTRRTAMLRQAGFTTEEAQEVGEVIGIDWDEVLFSPQDLADGMDVELEHGTELDPRVNVTDDDVNQTAQIAWAHLMEDPDYYIVLEAMEQDFDGVVTPELREGKATRKNSKQPPRTSARIQHNAVTLLVDHENTSEEWWESGGSDLWHQYAGGADEVELFDRDVGRFLSRAKRIPGWSDGPDYAPYPIFINETAEPVYDLTFDPDRTHVPAWHNATVRRALSTEPYRRAKERADVVACRDGIVAAIKSIKTRVLRTNDQSKLLGVDQLVGEMYRELNEAQRVLSQKL